MQVQTSKNQLLLGACGDVARTSDPDRFLLSLGYPPDLRPEFWALIAFQHEIAKTRETVTDTTLGLIRLQWWRDAVYALYEGQSPPANPVLEGLAPLIRGPLALQKPEFETLIHAREFDLEEVLPSDFQGMSSYAAFTSAPFCRLWLCLSDETYDPKSLEKVAVAYGLLGLIRSIPFHAAQRRCYLPEDMLDDHEITLRQLYNDSPPEALPSLIRDLCKKIKRLNGTKPPQGRLLKGMHCLNQIYLDHIQKKGYTLFNPKINRLPLTRNMRVLWAMRH